MEPVAPVAAVAPRSRRVSPTSRKSHRARASRCVRPTHHGLTVRHLAGGVEPTLWWYAAMMRPLTTDLTREDLRPYFCWDEDVSIAEVRAALRGPDPEERRRVLGRLLREARDTDVWSFVSPQEVAEALPSLGRHLGRRRGFWEYLIGRWRARGLVR